ncbi:DUF1302 domain-containing protein [Pseudoduganella sp. OTU4001]|uniref:DUF1302 domain-containing protein n=1 Tax=Pseudoduganella sp. OTU4001 TaxID=3043854 RepID=UPI00313F08BB
MNKIHIPRPLRMTVAVAAALCSSGPLQATEIETGNPDLAIRWDNTFKYNYANRVNQQHQGILKSANNDDGDRNFGRGTVSNRVDLLTEFDVVYQKSMGLRVSAAAWHDGAYRDLDNANVASSNHVVGGKPALGLSEYARRYHYSGGELLDAFVFFNTDVAERPLNLKLGRHTVVWGESLLTPVHGVNYGQSSLDLIKAYTVPGTEAKELFLPRSQVSAQFSATDELSFAAQYFFKWKPARLPEAGSFLGFYDYGFQGAEAYNLGPLGLAYKQQDSTPEQRGDWGVSARWSPAWLDGTVGAYARRTGDLLPQANVRLVGLPLALLGGAGGAAAGGAACKAFIPGAVVAGANCAFYPGQLSANAYQLEYAGKVDVFGVSLSKSVAGVSVGAELSYRRNMPLVSTSPILMPVGTNAAVVGALAKAFAPTSVAAAALPGEGGVSGAVGNTMHGLVNVFGITAKTPLFDAATWIAELTWNKATSVKRGAQFYKGRADYTGVDKVDGDFYGLAANFTPTWYQVFPGVDVSAPMSASVGLKGNSPILVGGNKDAGNYSLGLSFDIRAKYKFDLKWTDFFGPLGYNAAGAISSNAGTSPLLKDRGFISATFKTTF